MTVDTPERRITRQRRRGVISLFVAMSLLVVMSGVALVLDRLWLQAAAVELQTCAEASALAAARVLAGDELLSPDTPRDDRLERARQAAGRIAVGNRVAGHPVQLDLAPDGDVRFGRLVTDHSTRQTRFLETDVAPTSVLVTAVRSRRRRNPVALFLGPLTGQWFGDVSARAEATIDNRVIALRPLPTCPIPALPLAVLNADPAGSRSDTWETQIEQRLGQDHFSFDEESGHVLPVPDGLPEIVLRSRRDPNADDVNVRLLRLGTGQNQNEVFRQIRRGWSITDLEPIGGRIPLLADEVDLPARTDIPPSVQATLTEMTGICRICLLYTPLHTAGSTESGRLRCAGAVAGRIMRIRSTGPGECEIVFQPAVITTRTAVLATEAVSVTAATSERTVVGHRYIHKLQLTY